jgi:hypothetical protein
MAESKHPYKVGSNLESREALSQGVVIFTTRLDGRSFRVTQNSVAEATEQVSPRWSEPVFGERNRG